MNLRAISLTTAELLLLTQMVLKDGLGIDQPIDTEHPIDVEQTLETLAEQDLIISLPPENKPGVTSELATLLLATLSPDRVLILRITHQEKPSRTIYLSQRDDYWVCNFVKEDETHLFADIPSPADVVNLMMTTLDSAMNDTANMVESERPLDQLLPQAETLCLLMKLDDLETLETGPSQVLSWLVSENQLWLLDAANDTTNALAQSITPTNLQSKLATYVT